MSVILMGANGISFDTIQKLGQPVPESNLDFELKSSAPQQMHEYIPFSLWFQ